MKFQVNDAVVSFLRDGRVCNGIVTNIDYSDDMYPIHVKFEGDNMLTKYTANGCLHQASRFVSVLDYIYPKGSTCTISVKEAPQPVRPTFEPLEAVLVRQFNNHEWQLSLFSHDKCSNKDTAFKKGRFVTISGEFNQCIPFKGSELLLGTSDTHKQINEV